MVERQTAKQEVFVGNRLIDEFHKADEGIEQEAWQIHRARFVSQDCKALSQGRHGLAAAQAREHGGVADFLYGMS